jgi:hypothetical protein
MSIRLHAGYWTIFVGGKPVLSFWSRAEAKAMVFHNLSVDARLLYLLLFTVTDNHGKFRGASSLLADGLFPDDAESQERIPESLQALEDVGFIRQKFNQQDAFISIPHFADIIAKRS